MEETLSALAEMQALDDERRLRARDSPRAEHPRTGPRRRPDGAGRGAQRAGAPRFLHRRKPRRVGAVRARLQGRRPRARRSGILRRHPDARRAGQAPAPAAGVPDAGRAHQPSRHRGAQLARRLSRRLPGRHHPGLARSLFSRSRDPSARSKSRAAGWPSITAAIPPTWSSAKSASSSNSPRTKSSAKRSSISSPSSAASATRRARRSWSRAGSSSLKRSNGSQPPVGAEKPPAINFPRKRAQRAARLRAAATRSNATARSPCTTASIW